MAPIFFTHINQPKVNNIAATRAGHKRNPLIRVIQGRPSVRSDSVFFLFEIIVTKLNSVWSLFQTLFHNRISLASVLIYYGNYLVN